MSASEFFLSAWTWKPPVLIGCFALAALYGWAVGYRFNRKTFSWLAGLVILLVAFVSPLDRLADTYLFSAHMARHILFVLIVPALLLMGLPAALVERAPGKCSVAAPVGWIAGVGAMVFWHIPLLFRLACSHPSVRIAEHLSLLAGGTIFWWPILAPLERARMRPVPQGIAYLFSACLACTGIGVLITFSPSLLYPAYSHPADAYGILPMIRNGWGISPAMDQQIGGLLMWVPCCFVYLTAIMAMFARWYGEETENPMEVQWT